MKKPTKTPSLIKALNDYKNSNNATLRLYLSESQSLDTKETKKILLALDKLDVQKEIEQDILCETLRKGENMFDIFFGPYRLSEEFLILTPTTYKEIREILIQDKNKYSTTKINSIDLESLTYIFSEDMRYFEALLGISYPLLKEVYNNTKNAQKATIKYYNSLENLNFSYQAGDFPNLEKTMKQLCADKQIANHKANVVENIMALVSQKGEMERMKSLLEFYNPEVFTQKFIATLKELTQVYIDKNKLTQELKPLTTKIESKKTIKI